MGKIPEQWRKVSVTPVGKKGTTGRLASPQAWEGDGVNPPGNHFQTHESDEEKSARIYKRKKIMLKQPDALQQGD